MASKEIATNKIGLNAVAEYIPDAAETGFWQGIQCPDGAAITSGAFLLSQTMGATELKIIVGDDGLETLTGPVTVTVVTSPTYDGSYDDTVFTQVVTADTTYEIGDDLVKYIPPREQTEMWAKVVFTVTTDDLAAYSIDGFVTMAGG